MNKAFLHFLFLAVPFHSWLSGYFFMIYQHSLEDRRQSWRIGMVGWCSKFNTGEQAYEICNQHEAPSLTTWLYRSRKECTLAYSCIQTRGNKGHIHKQTTKTDGIRCGKWLEFVSLVMGDGISSSAILTVKRPFCSLLHSTRWTVRASSSSSGSKYYCYHYLPHPIYQPLNGAWQVASNVFAESGKYMCKTGIAFH